MANQGEIPENRFLTTGQVARMCGVNFRTVLRWIKKGYLNANRLPGRGDHRISHEELLVFLTKNQMPVPSEINAKPPPSPSFENLSDTLQRRILIVEDDLAAAHSLQRILKSAGYETKIATGGFEAGILLTEFRPSLITLDIHMNGMNGLDVLRLMKSNPLLQAIKVLIVSGDTSGKAEDALLHGAHGLIAKPFQRVSFLSVVKELLEKEAVREESK